MRPKEWMFEIGPQGKPRVAGGDGPQFNLSHCDELVACAASQCVPLGIDVENLYRHAPLQLAERYFAPTEVTWLRSLPSRARLTGFIRLWTLKEAYLKATGFGFSQRLNSFAFEFEPLRVVFFDPALGDATAWRFRQYPIGSRHMLALAWQAAETDMTVEVVAVRFEVQGRCHICVVPAENDRPH